MQKKKKRREERRKEKENGKKEFSVGEIGGGWDSRRIKGGFEKENRLENNRAREDEADGGHVFCTTFFRRTKGCDNLIFLPIYSSIRKRTWTNQRVS